MRAPRGHARAAGLALAAAGLALWFLAGLGARALRALEAAAGLAPGRRAGGEALASALGGFRGLVADFIWLRAIQMQDEGRFDEITLLSRLILDLQPSFTGVWDFLSWNLAYNLAFESNTPEERWRWIRAGLDLLEEDGIRRNPNSYALYWRLGFMYFFRVSAKGRDPFYRHYQEALAPVPDWCRDDFEFVDEGLWSDRGIRYRLYRRRAGPGRVTLGGASAAGGEATRARQMYIVMVAPGDALRSATISEETRAFTLEPGRAHVQTCGLAPGAPLYSDAADRVSASEAHPVPWGAPLEPAVPRGLSGAALVPLPEAARTRSSEEYLTLELDRPAEVWVGWYPDETRNFLLARKWLVEAETKPDCNTLMVSRLRVHALVETGEWEEAYREFQDLHRSRPPGDESVPGTFRNFLLTAVYSLWRSGDREGAGIWHERLQEDFPSWRMPPAETADWVATERGE